MKKIRVFDGDGKTRDERESCFPMMSKKQNEPPRYAMNEELSKK